MMLWILTFLLTKVAVVGGQTQTHPSSSGVDDGFGCAHTNQLFPTLPKTPLGSLKFGSKVSTVHGMAMEAEKRVKKVYAVAITGNEGCHARDITKWNVFLNFKYSHFPPEMVSLVIVDTSEKPSKFFQDKASVSSSRVKYVHAEGKDAYQAINHAISILDDDEGNIAVFLNPGNIYRPSYLHYMASNFEGSNDNGKMIGAFFASGGSLVNVDTEGSVHTTDVLKTRGGCRKLAEHEPEQNKFMCEWAVDLSRWKSAKCTLTTPEGELDIDGHQLLHPEHQIVCQGKKLSESASPRIGYSYVNDNGVLIMMVADTPNVPRLPYVKPPPANELTDRELDACPTAPYRQEYYATFHALLRPACIKDEGYVVQKTMTMPPRVAWVRAVQEI
mmetsp:Transcript_24691/g.46127  ORF Transcript_24691/g.46127 Transcript_24691/m.46127 type:complete len:387 (-) Transcript_24691:255-1415(-)